MAKAHVYKRDHINTDEIIPARYLNTDNEAELAKHCMEDLDKDFVAKVKPGDVIVAGDEFLPLPDFAQEIIRDGGLLDHIMKTSA
jgi:3-isopropylmalate/(R)-2-methylmalate dehydratase small subunit